MKQRFAFVVSLLAVFSFHSRPNLGSVPSLRLSDDQEVFTQLATISEQFSATYVKGDIEKLVSFYTDDAVIFPGNSDLIRGKEAIRKYWRLPPGRTITHHKITSLEIRIVDNFAHDYGYYELSGRNQKESWGPNYGKYLVIWKRGENGAWRMHLDMWNSRPKPE